MSKMKKSNDLRKKIVEAFKDKNNWNKRVEIDGNIYIYISAANEVRVICNRGKFETANLIGCFTLIGGYSSNYGIGRFMWCCM